MLRQTLAACLIVSLAGAPAALAQPAPSDRELLAGIRQVEDGDYDSGIVTLDAAAHRLAGDPARIRDLSQAYLYLGIAYVGKGHEAAAKAKFREAVAQVKDLALSSDKFPPKVIDLFEAARAEIRAEVAAAPTPAPAAAPAPAPAKKSGGGAKTFLILGGLAVAGGGVALAAGGGGGGGGATATTLPAGNMQMFTGTVTDQEQRRFTVVASKAGTLEATLTWQDRTIQLDLGSQLSDPPYTSLGNGNRTTDTTDHLSFPVTGATTYLLYVSNYSGRAGAEPFTLTVLYP